MSKDVYCGIDLGTTYTSVGVYEGGNVRCLTDEFNSSCIPSLVSFTENDCKVGRPPFSCTCVIQEIKRFLGKDWEDLKSDKGLKSLLDKNQNDYIDIEGKIGIGIERPTNSDEIRTLYLTPEDVSAIILLKIKQIVLSKYPGKNIKAIVGVPASFGDKEKAATQAAVKMAGIELIRTVNEPTAAARAYKMKEGTLFVFDFGGGTLDISIVTFKNGSLSKTVTSKGDPFLGGNDMI
ncbi:heat shock protein, putative, partial [Entamoeba invadens IP1]|uniref:heat shock protein, putative n=1 Tax=Entamoeba invadens IP1 TaxID=370355 RepID=UPI0002C3F5A8